MPVTFVHILFSLSLDLTRKLSEQRVQTTEPINMIFIHRR